MAEQSWRDRERDPHAWEKWGPDGDYSYGVVRRYWCQRCGARRESTAPKDAYGLENGEATVVFCAPMGYWDEIPPRCVAPEGR